MCLLVRAGRARKPFTVGWIGKVKTPWTADRAMTTVAWPYNSQHYSTRTQLQEQYRAPWGTVGSGDSAMTHVIRWFKCLLTERASLSASNTVR